MTQASASASSPAPPPAPAPAPAGSVLGTFPASFWVANVMELFERGAYYGMNAVLGRYLTDKTGGALGFGEDSAGLLQSLIYAATYVVPILGGALADRYGYRRMLLFAFSLLSAGYFLSGEATSYWILFSTLLVMATGAGLFKPIISGTIARTTSERNSGFGFGVYYWMINLGALIAPLVAYLLRGRFGWSAVFFASSSYCALMLLPALFIYRDPPRPESTRTLQEVLRGAVTVLSDARFMLMVVVYSCFWILYFQNFGTVLWYLRDFVDAAPVNALFARAGLGITFDAEFVTMINAGTIVVLQLAVSRIVRDRKPLPTMVAGILIGTLGFTVLAASQNVWVFIAGIAVFSIGEMTCHPKYYSYVGLVAPQEQKAVYMGYAFLYGVVGSLVGSNVGGEAYNALLKPLVGQAGAAPTLRGFWLVFAALGVLTSVGMVAYNHWFSEDTPATRQRARRVMIGVYTFLLAAAAAILARKTLKTGALDAKTAIQSGILILIGVGGLLTITGKAADRVRR